MIRFDGWNDTYNYLGASPYYSKFQHRFSSNYPDGHLKGTGVDTVAIVEAENVQASDAGATAWAWDFYLPAEVTHAADPDEWHEWLQAGLEAYLQTSNKSLMKFWVTVLTDDHYGLSYPATDQWKYLDDFAAYVANLMQDPQYLRWRGRPVIGLFSRSATGHGPNMDLAHWQQFLAPMGGQSAVWAIEMDGNISSAQDLTEQAIFTYGVQNLGSSLGHKAWSYIGNIDSGFYGSAVPTFFPISPANTYIDARPFDNAVTARTFTDAPTQPEMYQHFRDAQGAFGAAGHTQMILSFWNELAEEATALSPSTQEGTRFLDAAKWARKHILPATYTYEMNLYSLGMTNVGTWTYVDPWSDLAIGAHDRDEIHSSTTGDSKALTHVNMTECGLYASTGPDRGILDVEVDDVDVADVDLYTASPAVHQLVWTAGALANATHKCEFIVKGTKNASSSSVKVQLDSVQITYSPSP